MKVKRKERLSLSAMAERLRSVAEEVASGRLALPEGIFEVPGQEGLFSLKVKQEEGELEIELKLEFEVAGAEPSEGQRETPREPSSRALKKEMEALFKALGRELSGGGLPDPALAERFLEVHRLYDPYATEFKSAWEEATRLAEDLLSAVQEGNLDTAREIFQKIALSKKTCHKLYKK
ncbi:GAK system XXXCH domain-containing protein [Thermosulfurimonas marina]|uniref:GAK system XXXCH domain-containing protein n=1 Tax=Thermosulfurimonas marina TaxID=2047767 RepID=A0A6H1WTL5_9BACT|nr:GAK system XXXCH domain-containing protein [Thermosulfurimonas marina]QJA06489.1 GAK system XXXCH domain-containing protein [Thermosulfurimonas marina]